MKPTDLMIGDWVYNTHNNKPEQVQEVLTVNDIDYAVMLDYRDIYYEDDIEPIPLTPEILEKNGFILEYNGYNYYENLDNTETNYLCVSFRTNKQPRKIEFEFTNKIFGKIKTIQYVHEFQHLLKLCKINMEIKL